MYIYIYIYTHTYIYIYIHIYIYIYTHTYTSYMIITHIISQAHDVCKGCSVASAVQWYIVVFGAIWLYLVKPSYTSDACKGCSVPSHGGVL